MSNYTYTVVLSGTTPNDYYMYTPSEAERRGMSLDFHVTVPISDKFVGRYGTYPHITIDWFRNSKGKWVAFPGDKHWYLYSKTDSSVGVVNSSGTALELKSGHLLIVSKVVADMAEYGAWPWTKNGARSTKR